MPLAYASALKNPFIRCFYPCAYLVVCDYLGWYVVRNCAYVNALHEHHPLFKWGSALSQATLVGRMARVCARLLRRGNTPIPALCSSGKRGDALMWPHMYKQLFIGLVA